MAGLGARLRTLRQQWRLSLREVAQRSSRIARQRGDLSYQVSASWLKRLESDEHEFTVHKLIALTEIYSIPPDQLIRSTYTAETQSLSLDQLSSPNATILLTEGSRKPRAKRLLSATSFPEQSADQTTLLPVGNKPSRTPYRRGIIGKLDLTLDPMIPAGSFVRIDTGNCEISSTKECTNEFRRPVYFLMTPEGYVCGWCELDSNSEWLTLIPHPLSLASSRRWKYRTEVQNLGRVIGVVIRSGE
jgi:transcriptional regulator with XRE-family HTH domain